MKTLLIIFSLFTFQNQCIDIDDIRNKFHHITSKVSLQDFINILNKSNCDLKGPYYASAIMQSAKYSFWPTKKIENFNQGKKILETFIKSNPANIEARYIRILIQNNAPEILGYHKDKISDIKFIKNHIFASNLPNSYIELILSNISEMK